MNLYLLDNPESGYGQYDSAVVAAESEDDARLIHPDGNPIEGNIYSWVSAERVVVKYIGIAVEGTESGVICASLNP